MPAGAQQPDQEVLVGEPGAAAGVQLHCVGAGEARPLREGGDAGDDALGAQALALLRQDLQDGLHHQQLVHTGPRPRPPPHAAGAMTTHARLMCALSPPRQ